MGRSKRVMLWAACSLALATAACTEGAERGSGDVAVAARPETRMDTLLVEGIAEPLSLRLYRSPPEFPLPFRTYVPEDMLAEPISSGEGDGIRFVTNFAGARYDAAQVHLFVYPRDATEDAARETVRSVAEAFGPIRAREEVESASRYSWSIVEYKLQGGGTEPMNGSVALGRHAGRLFHLTLQFPVEFGDGFAPRARKIMEEWRWEDTGEPLLEG